MTSDACRDVLVYGAPATALLPAEVRAPVSPDVPTPALPPFRADLRATVRLAAPVAAAQAAMVAMGVVDAAVVGRVDTTALAAVGLGGAMTFALVVLGFGLPLALEPLASQALGAGEPGRARAWWLLASRWARITSLPLGGLVLGACALLEPLGVEPELADRTFDYVLARTPAVLGILDYWAGRAYLQASGHVRPLWVSALVANLVNLAADVLLVHGDAALESVGLPALGLPAMAEVGAGVATTLSTFVMLAIVRRAITARDAATPGAHDLPTEPPPMATLVRLGGPIALTTFAETALFSVVGLLAARLGEDAMAAHNVALNLATMSFMAAVGVGGAASTRVGQAIGRGDTRAARRAGAAASAVGMGLMGGSALVFATFPGPLASLFGAEPDVTSLVVDLLGIAALFQLADGLQVVMAGALRGAGDVRMPFVANLSAHWAVGFPTAWWLAFEADLGLHGLWYGLTISLVAVATFLALRFVVLTSRPIARVEGDGPGSQS